MSDGGVEESVVVLGEDGRGILQRLTDTENLAVGMAAGLIEQLGLQPILYWKHASQQRMPFTMDPRLLYRGTGASCMNMASLTGLQFQLSGVMQKFIAGDSERALSSTETIAAGFIGGALSGPICCALELTLIQQQRFGGTFIGTPARIVSTYGPSGIMRGFIPSTGREALFTVGCLGLVPVAKRKLHEDAGLSSSVASVVASVGAGLTCAAFSHPLDTLKTCMQGDLERKTYGTMTQTARALYAESGGGFGAFFRGYGWRSTNIILDFMILNALMETLAPVMYAERFCGSPAPPPPPSF